PEGRWPGRFHSRGGGHERHARCWCRAPAAAHHHHGKLMSISLPEWLLAFIAALLLHALGGGLLWLSQERTPQPPQTPRGIMVTLDSRQVGNSPETASAPTAATPATAPVAEPDPAS